MIKLAWRNIWRNRRRAVITMASVFFAVFFCTVMMGIQAGAWGRMVENMLRTQTGHIQIHAKGYWEEKIIDNFMFMDSVTISALENINEIETVSPRVETFAMAASGSVSKGIAIVGVSPAKETLKSNLPSRILKGEYLTENDDGILIGEGLARYLKVSAGDTLAFIGQGYHGSSATGLFPIRGILKLMTIEMDNGMAYMTLTSAQTFIDMPDGYSGILISIKDNNRLDETMGIIKYQLSAGGSRHYEFDPQSPENKGMLKQVQHNNDSDLYEVLSWHFTMERLLQQTQSDKAFGNILMLIMYVIVGFGILGTVIMMTNERKREFCVMISLGMQRTRLATVIAAELFFMSLTAVALAFVVTLSTGHWFAAHPIKITGEMGDMFVQYGMEPILPMSVHPSIFITQMTFILVIVLLACIYPVSKILKLELSKNK
jgi:ABC-type lipoprotein release transport system permease subunit